MSDCGLSIKPLCRKKFPKLEQKNIQFWFKNRRAKCKRINNDLKDESSGPGSEVDCRKEAGVEQGGGEGQAGQAGCLASQGPWTGNRQKGEVLDPKGPRWT